MILIDANLLLYAYYEGSPHHFVAKQWLDNALDSEEQVGLPLQSILAFVRVSTNTGLHGSRRPIQTVLAIIDFWLALPHADLIVPGATHWERFKQLCLAEGVSGNLSTDAHIAALAIELDATLYSADRDFARFAGLRWVNPLARG